MKIDLTDRTIEKIDYGNGVVLHFRGGVEIRIETPFELSFSDHKAFCVDPQNIDDPDEFFQPLFNRSVVAAVAVAESGVLLLSFDGGMELRVFPHRDFEAWTAVWPDGSIVVCLPGGGLTKWTA